MPGQSFRGFAERVALVTGGARGVGRAVALQLALEGAYVIVSYAPEDSEGGRVANELRELGTLGHAFASDVSRASEVRSLFAAVEATYGRLDMLVNASGAAEASTAHTTLDALTPEAWEEVLDGSLKSAFLCAQAAARMMRTRPSPAIVNVASDAGVEGIGAAHAVAAHAGLIGLTKALAHELAPRIRVNCVASGVVETGDVLGQAAAGTQAEMDAENAAGGSRPARLLAPDEVARACVYLLSPEAVSITGQTLVVGGRR